MSISREELIQHIESMSVTELTSLIEALQQRLGVGPVSAPASREGALVVGAPERATMGVVELEVRLVEVGPSPMEVLKLLRERTALPLSEARKLLVSLPLVLAEYVTSAEANRIAEAFRAVGAVVDVR